MRPRTLAVLLLVGLAGGATAVLVARGGAARPRAAAPARVTYYCPMHPQIVSDRAGSCPICGMALVPRTDQPSAAPVATRPADVPRDRAVVTLSADRRSVLGLKSEPAVTAVLDRTLRTVGRVAVDERRVHHVHVKFEAYVEKLYVDFTGKHVQKGQPLVALYSPELVATQQEYLLALRAQKRLAESALPNVARGGVDLLEAARQRLLLWDVRPDDVRRLETAGEVRRTLDLVSPASGFVTAKTALHGMRVTPADTLFDIADLSHLWVMADVYEADLPSVRPGVPAEVTLAYLPGRSWRGQVTWIAPTVDPQSRTVKVRVEVDNAGGELKPEMFADVTLRTGRGSGLMVPESAVLRSGERDLVFVDHGDGRFEPRRVTLGGKGATGVQVLSGLAEGDRVVTAANFLLDSESSLKAALQAMASPAPGARPSTPAATPRPSDPGAHRH